MGEHTGTGARPHDGRPGSLGELIHAAVRHAIEVAVDEELTAALGARPYERGGGRGRYRHGTKARTLTGPTGPLALAVPRARLFTPTGRREWASSLLPPISAGCGRSTRPWSPPIWPAPIPDASAERGPARGIGCRGLGASGSPLGFLWPEACRPRDSTSRCERSSWTPLITMLEEDRRWRCSSIGLKTGHLRRRRGGVAWGHFGAAFCGDAW